MQMETSNFKVVRKVTLVGLWINVALVAAKLFFGYWGRSDALVADGYHSVSDFITDFIVIAFVSASYKKADKEHPYGHGKFETIATVLISIVLLCVGVFIGYEGITTLINATIHGEILPRPDIWTLYVAVFSILAKEFCYRYTVHYAGKVDSPALKANAWHHRSDAISSVATLAGVSFALFMGERWRVMDPIASVIIAFMIIVPAIRIAMPSINELLEASLPPGTIRQMTEIIKSVPGVLKVHNLRSRRNGHSCLVDVNIHVDADISVRQGHAIASDVERHLHKAFGSDMIIYVHIEPQESAAQ